MSSSPRDVIPPQSFMLVSELVLSAVHAVIDTGNNLRVLSIPNQEDTNPTMYWYDTRRNAMHVCRHYPLDYNPAHFVSMQCPKPLVSGIVQPESLKSIVLRSSSLVVQRTEGSVTMRFPLLSTLNLSASTMTMRETLGYVDAVLTVGSELRFTPGAVCDTLHVRFGDNNPNNLVQGTYYDEQVTCPEGAGKVDVARVSRPNRRRSTSPLGSSHWVRQIPVVAHQAGHNVCQICYLNNATWAFTACGCATLCSECVTASLRNNFIGPRLCPVCRTTGRPSVAPPPPVVS